MFNLSKAQARIVYRQQIVVYHLSTLATILSAGLTLWGITEDLNRIVLIVIGGCTGYFLCLTSRTEHVLNMIRRMFPEMVEQEEHEE
jgi:Flp pilus assembly protein TadB